MPFRLFDERPHRLSVTTRGTWKGKDKCKTNEKDKIKIERMRNEKGNHECKDKCCLIDEKMMNEKMNEKMMNEKMMNENTYNEFNECNEW